MTLRMQALCCFSAVAALFLYPSTASVKYVAAVAAGFLGVTIWQRDKRQRAERAVQRARVEAIARQGEDDSL